MLLCIACLSQVLFPSLIFIKIIIVNIIFSTHYHYCDYVYIGGGGVFYFFLLLISSYLKVYFIFFDSHPHWGQRKDVKASAWYLFLGWVKLQQPNKTRPEK